MRNIVLVELDHVFVDVSAGMFFLLDLNVQSAISRNFEIQCLDGVRYVGYKIPIL